MQGIYNRMDGLHTFTAGVTRCKSGIVNSEYYSTGRILIMFLTLLVLLLVAFIPFQVYKAVVAWRLTKGIKEFKE